MYVNKILGWRLELMNDKFFFVEIGNVKEYIEGRRNDRMVENLR